MERYTSSKFRKLSSSCPVSVLKVFTKCVLHILSLDHGEYTVDVFPPVSLIYELIQKRYTPL